MTALIDIPGEKNQITGAFMPAIGEAPLINNRVLKLGTCSHNAQVLMEKKLLFSVLGLPAYRQGAMPG